MVALYNEEFNPFSISPKNSKLGNIPNCSLTPGISCSPDACKTCHVNGCYAMKSYRMYPSVRASWDNNTALALFALDALEEQLNEYFDSMVAPRYFRIHVGGDFITRAYAEMWYRVAKAHPFTHFLAFTKQFDNVRDIPFNELDNFALILSDWDGIEIPVDLAALYPIAYCIGKGEKAPENAIKCPGHCEKCNGKCWHLHKAGECVAFEKH